MAEADDIVGVAVAAEEVARGGDEVAAPPSHMDGGGAGSLLARQGGEGCDLC